MAKKRLAAAGLSVNEDELGVDVVQALRNVITGKKVTDFPEVCNSLLHHMPTLLETKTPTLGEAIEMSGTALYVGYTGQDDVSYRFLISSNKTLNPVLSKMDGSSITRSEAKDTFGFASSVVYTCKSKLNARKVEVGRTSSLDTVVCGARITRERSLTLPKIRQGSHSLSNHLSIGSRAC
jgi:hypothetical protein